MKKNIKKFYQNKRKQSNQTIDVRNALGEEETTAEVVVQNKIDYVPKVSVVVPVYNVEEYLKECLDSIRGQSLKEIEIICVDDGSTDGSLEILKEYAAKDKRISVLSQKNLYAGVARNAGLAVAKGEYLSFLDSDDFFEKTLLEETYNLAKKEQSEIVFYQYTNYNNETKEKEQVAGINKRFSDDEIYTVTTEEIKESLFTICNPMPWNKLIRRDFVVKEDLHYQNLPAANDVCFSLTTIACAEKITLYYKSLVYYRHNRTGSLKNTRDKNPLNFYEAYKGIYGVLQEKGLYEKYKKTFLTSLISSSLWTMNHTEQARETVKNFIKDEIIPKYISGNEDIIDGGLLYRLNRVYCPDLIVSLTSYPGRIGTVHQTIETLLNQSLKADKVILWLAPEQFPNKEKDLPQELLDLKEKGLTIDWYEDIKSYKKLIPTLKKYPEAMIVTADDDLLYHKDLLKSLYDSYLENPECIHCHRITRLYYLNGALKIVSRTMYSDDKGRYLEKLCLPNAFNKLSSGAGTLFPPHCFAKDVIDEKKFMKLAPTSDDIWFYLMGLLNGYKVKVIKNNVSQLSYVPGTQDEALCSINDRFGHKIFFEHLNNIIKKYPKLKEKFETDNEANNQILDEVFEKAQQKRIRELDQWWRKIKGQPLNLYNPKTFNEKIQWLKVYDSTPIKTKLADKYLVRDWVKEKIGEEYLIPLLGVYDSFEEINFDTLPDQFVMKCNHGSGWNIIVKDKSKLDLEEAKAKFDKWMNENFAFKVGYELHYRDIEPKIVIEKYIDEIGTALYDYRFFCCNGKLEQIWLDVYSGTPNHKRKIYDKNWNELNIVVKWPRLETYVPKPNNLEVMIDLAEKMSKGFALVRVDFYDVNDKIYFGEMTFSSMSGTGSFEPAIEDLKLGKKIKLPKLAYNIDTGKYYKAPRSNIFKTLLLFPYYVPYNLIQKIKSFNLRTKEIEQNVQRMRIDIKNVGNERNAVEINAPQANILEAPWMKNAQGSGQIVESSEIRQKLSIKTIKDGKLQFVFRGRDKRNGKGVRLPVWIDYKSIKIDGKEILEKPVETWHDKPYRYEMEVKDGQTVNVEVKQIPHQYGRGDLRVLIKVFYPNLSDLDSISKIVHRKFDRRRSLSYQLFHKKTTENAEITYICGIKVFKKKLKKKTFFKDKLVSVFKKIKAQKASLKARFMQIFKKKTDKKPSFEKQFVELSSKIEKMQSNMEMRQKEFLQKTNEQMMSQMSAKLEKVLDQMGKEIEKMQSDVKDLQGQLLQKIDEQQSVINNLQVWQTEQSQKTALKTAKIIKFKKSI